MAKGNFKELMRVFRDLDMVEHLGSGIPRILRTYPPDCFEFTENFVRTVFPMGSGATSITRENDTAGQETTQADETTTPKTTPKTTQNYPKLPKKGSSGCCGLTRRRLGSLWRQNWASHPTG